MNQALLVIYASENGRDGWQPVKADDLPEWVRAPETIGRLVAGEMCMKADEGDKGSLWYRAGRNHDLERQALAERKRMRRGQKRLSDLAAQRIANRDRGMH